VSDRQITGMPAGFTPVVPFEECFDAVYGLEVMGADVDGEGTVRGRVEAGEHLLAAHGAVHGGVFAAAAEALASRGTALAVIPRGFAAMGQGNDTTVLAPVTGGAIEFEARVRTRAEDAWLWTVDARDEAGALVAFSRITVAVRPFPA
jgi:1,4-dihydroxy-2-naphthoyl-CoA hydrolase